MYQTTASMILEKNKREGSYPVYLYEVEIAAGASVYYTSNNQDVLFYIPRTSTPQVYTAIPISHDKIDSNTQGEVGTVQLSLQNVTQYVMSLLLNNNALRGCKVSIILVFSDSLDDPDNFLIDEYFIDSAAVTEVTAQFTLKSKFIVDKVVLPTRKYRRDQCAWSFKGVECAFKDRFKRELSAVTVIPPNTLSVAIPKMAVATSIYTVGKALKVTHWTDNTRSSVTTASLTCAGSSYVFSNIATDVNGSLSTLSVIVGSDIVERDFLSLYYESTTATAALSCKKTFSYCATLGNQNRFGNFPGIPTRNIYF